MTGRDGIAAQKAALRCEMLQALRGMTADERMQRSALICRRILDSEAWQKAERVLLFVPMRTEVDIGGVTSAALVARKEMAVVPTTLRAESDLHLPFVADLILVPGLAFGRDGHRLGRGGGFYDRLLDGRGRSATKVGVCFAFQLHDAVPVEAHDTVLNAVISD